MSMSMPETRQSSRAGGSRGEPQLSTDNPMHPEPLVKRLQRACRCGVRTRTGAPCQAPAIRGRARCRMHGGRSPGAPKGVANGNYVSGRWTEEAVEIKAAVRALVKASREMLREIG